MQKELAQHGYDIAVWDVQEDVSQATAEEVKKLGTKATVCVLDLTDDDAIAGQHDRSTNAEHGSIDVLINGAEFLGSRQL